MNEDQKVILKAAFTKILNGEVITPNDLLLLVKTIAEKVQVDGSPDKMEEAKTVLLQFLQQWKAAIEKGGA